MVLVETTGELEWQSAERRLTAELLEAGQSVTLLRSATGLDAALPSYARRFDAEAVIQIVRREEEGIVRVWLSDARRVSGEFRHVVVDLRGADVISEATLPTVELVLNAPRELAREPTPPPPRPRVANYGQARSSSHFAARTTAGVLFPGGGASPSADLTLGLRLGVLSWLSLDVEAFAEPAYSTVTVGDSRYRLGVSGARGLLVFEPWSRAPVSIGGALGAGMLRIANVPPRSQGEPWIFWMPVIAGRVQFSAPIFHRLDALMMMTWMLAAPGTQAYVAPGQSRAPLFDPGFEMVLGFDLHLF